MDPLWVDGAWFLTNCGLDLRASEPLKGVFEHLPMIHSAFSTMPGQVHEPIRDKVVEFAKRDGIYEFSYGYGFPFADVPFNSPVGNC